MPQKISIIAGLFLIIIGQFALGVEKDGDTDIQALTTAAEGGDAKAQCRLSWMYFDGDGVQQDYAKAVEWCRKSAAQGYVEAQLALGQMYNEGKGVAQDSTAAARWCRMAAEQGDVYAQFYLSGIYLDFEDYIEAARWCRKAAEQGYAAAQCCLGYMYSDGNGVLQDHTEAAKWFRKSAEQGEEYAQYSLAGLFFSGKGVTRDYEEAVKWCRKAAEQGYEEAQVKLGAMYYKGNGVTKDLEEASKWFSKAAEQGNTVAKRYLKVINTNSKDVQKVEVVEKADGMDVNPYASLKFAPPAWTESRSDPEAGSWIRSNPDVIMGMRFPSTVQRKQPAPSELFWGTDINLKCPDGEVIYIGSAFERVAREPVDGFILFIIRIGGKWRRFKEGSPIGFTVPGYEYTMGTQDVYWLPSKKKVEGCAVLFAPDDFYRIAFVGGGAECVVGNYSFILPSSKLGALRSLWRKSGLKR